MAKLLVALLIIIFTSMVLVQTNKNAQNALLHTSETSNIALSSNEVRLSSVKSATNDALHHPLGQGPGTRPASFRNDHPAKIAENYYLQIFQEVGLLGMGIFIAINVIVGFELWKRQKDLLSLALLASLIGLTFVNVVSHAWSDDTLAYLWWGLAGLALAPDILGTRLKHNGKTYQTKT